MIICIGAAGSGKTLLLKRLHTECFNSSHFFDIPNTVPTVGTNIVNIRNENTVITIVEVGGAMTPIWEQYLDNDLHAILYVIDATNLSKIAISCTSLINLLVKTNTKHLKPLLIVLNKTDVNCTSNIDEMRYFLMIDDVMRSLPDQRIEVIETSCITGKGLSKVLDWIQSLNK